MLICWKGRVYRGSQTAADLPVCLNVPCCVSVQIKCDQYWPNRGSEVYGVMHVTLLDVIELATYTIRTFQLTRVCSGHPIRRYLIGRCALRNYCFRNLFIRLIFPKCTLGQAGLFTCTEKFQF